MDGAVTKRASISSQASEEGDEAALINSFFLPGGILNPDEENTLNEVAAAAASLVSADTTSLHEPVSLSNNNKASATAVSGMAWLPSAPASFPPNNENNALTTHNSFWSGGVGSNQNESLWPATSASVLNNEQPGPDMTDSFFGNATNTSAQRQPIQGNQHNTDPEAKQGSIFAHENTFSDFGGTTMQQFLLKSAVARHSIESNAGCKSFGHVNSINLTRLLGSSEDQIQIPPHHQHQPSRTEEDVRQMVQALSSTLANPTHPNNHTVLPEHLIRPDSPPKIIRQRSSISNSRANQQGPEHGSAAFPLDLPASHLNNGTSPSPDSIDYLSITSSLSSGSAQGHDPPISVTTTGSAGNPLSSSLVAGDPINGSAQHHPQQIQWTQKFSREQHARSKASGPLPLVFGHSAPAALPPPGYANLTKREHSNDFQHRELSKSKQMRFSSNGNELTSKRTQQQKQKPPPNLSTLPTLKHSSSENTKKPKNIQVRNPASYSSISRSKNSLNKNGSAPSCVSPIVNPAAHVHVKPETKRPLANQTIIEQSSTYKKTANANVPSLNQHSSQTDPITATTRQRKAPKPKRQIQQNSFSPLSEPRPLLVALDPRPEKQSREEEEEQQQEVQKETRSYDMDRLRNNPRKRKDDTRSSTGKAVLDRSTKAQYKPRPSKTLLKSWFALAFDAAAIILHAAEFFFQLLKETINQAAKEAMEQQDIATYYFLLYTAPAVSYILMSVSIWFPHYLPGITMGGVLWWICRHILNEVDPFLSLATSDGLIDETSPTAQEQVNVTSAHPGSKRKNRSHQNSHVGPSNRNPSSEALRLQELRYMEAKICRTIVTHLHWSLPVLVFVQSVLYTPSSFEGENLSSIRLVGAFALSALKTYNLLSPLVWLSASIQTLFILWMRHSQYDFGRWFGLEMWVTALGLTTLRFLRVHFNAGREKCDWNSFRQVLFFGGCLYCQLD